MNEYIEAVRALINNEVLKVDISDMLYNHKCFYLLSKLNTNNDYYQEIKIKSIVNKIYIHQRYNECINLFNRLEMSGIPYAVIKGAILSTIAYGQPYFRFSNDIDILIDRENISVVKSIMQHEGYVQGRIVDNHINLFSRQEVVFQTAMTHQTAPFIKKTNNRLCPYLYIDINLDILWGENSKRSDMKYVLQQSQDTKICDVFTKKLCPEMELISLCLHHYKDMNSIYLLYHSSLKLSLFCDIYFYIINTELNENALYTYCSKLEVSEYIYYCLYYTNLIFSHDKIKKYMSLLYSKNAEQLIDTFGLTEEERQYWNVDFFTRLFSTNLRDYLENSLSRELLKKIWTNQQYM